MIITQVSIGSLKLWEKKSLKSRNGNNYCIITTSQFSQPSLGSLLVFCWSFFCKKKIEKKKSFSVSRCRSSWRRRVFVTVEETEIIFPERTECGEMKEIGCEEKFLSCRVGNASNKFFFFFFSPQPNFVWGWQIPTTATNAQMDWPRMKTVGRDLTESQTLVSGNVKSTFLFNFTHWFAFPLKAGWAPLLFYIHHNYALAKRRLTTKVHLLCSP